MKLIECKSLSRTFKKGKNVIHALRDVSFTVSSGEFISIVGKSGSGKSSLLNLIGGLDKANGGVIEFDGKEMQRMSGNELAMHRRFSSGMIFQSFNLIKSRNALENVELALIFGGVARKERKKRAVELLSAVGLADRITHRPDELSGGETQRVAIARALANNPRMLLADEPTGNLDSETGSELMAMLTQLNKKNGLTIIMVTHDEETARRFSDRIIRLKDGAIAEITDNKQLP